MIDIVTADWQPLPKALGDRQAVFAIGDVHGYAAHLEALHDFIRQRILNCYDPDQVTLLWLGDYIDRGPMPLEAMDLVRQGLRLGGLREVPLCGNHEQFMLDFLDAPSESDALLASWLVNGGWDTVKAILPGLRPERPEPLAKALWAAVGAQRLEFLRSLPAQHREGGFVFAHAGINPARALDDQQRDDLLWIRTPFLSPKRWPHDVVVVHGHTPERPRVLKHRISIDSGVFYSKQLTALELSDAGLRFITAASPDSRPLGEDD